MLWREGPESEEGERVQHTHEGMIMLEEEEGWPMLASSVGVSMSCEGDMAFVANRCFSELASPSVEDLSLFAG